MKTAKSIVRYLLASLLLFPGAVGAQESEGEIKEALVLTKGRFRDPYISRYSAPYLNYGWIDYEHYREGIPIFKRYDAFGSYLTEGYEVFRMEEFRAANEGQPGSVLLKGRFYQNWLRHLIIADDAFGGWSTRVMVGDAIRTSFTPLTLDLARYNGVRWDQASANNRFTVLISRFSDPLKLELKNQLGPGGQRQTIFDGLFLMGGHWESHVGDFLVLGATFVNMHRFDSTKGFGTNTRKGLAPPFTVPRELVVRFQDDSPDDGLGGAKVFDVRGTVQIRESGEQRFEEILPARIEQSAGVVEGPRHLEASGRFADRSGLLLPVFVDYIFAVPDSAVGFEFSALVANDYRILLRQDHDFLDPSRNRADDRSTDFTIVRRAEGNVVDQSNRRRVVFEHGMQTGQEILGCNARLELKGFDIRGEVARSTHYAQYAARAGDRNDYRDFAWFINVQRRLSGLALGFESFRIGPKYQTYAFKSMARQNAEARPDLGRDGVDLDIQDQRTTGTPYYFNTLRQDPIDTDFNEGGNKLNNPIYSLVDDNDDMDQWPDDWVQDWDVANREIKYLESDAGIYPFFDFDADGFPDNNHNRNHLPDSEEPFLMYFTDPKEFYFGDDINNNFVLDMWEDDDQPNYPYDKDEEGIHLVAALEPFAGLTLIAGRYDISQIAGGGRNEVTYGRFKYELGPSKGWWLRLDHESKAVRDDIANPFFDFRVEALSDGRLVPEQRFFPDFLDARDSSVNRGMLHLKYRPGQRWNFNAKFRYELNDQHARVFSTGETQSADDLDYVGFLAKGDYTRRMGRWTFMPRFKVQYQRQERASLGLAFLDEFALLPIVRIDYHLTTRSQFRFGAQGLPLVKDRRIDYRDRDNDSNKQSYILTWFNRTDYGGYKLGTEAGCEYQTTDFDVRGRSDVGYVRYFVHMFAGVGTLLR